MLETRKRKRRKHRQKKTAVDGDAVEVVAVSSAPLSNGVQLHESGNTISSMTTKSGDVVTGNRAMVEHAVQFLQDSVIDSSLNSMCKKAIRYQNTCVSKSKLLDGCPSELDEAGSWIDRFVGRSSSTENASAEQTADSSSDAPKQLTTLDGMGMYNMMKSEAASNNSGMAPRRPYLNVSAVMPRCYTMEQFLKRTVQEESASSTATATATTTLSTHPDSISNESKRVTSYMLNVLTKIPYWEKQNGADELKHVKRPDPPILSAAHFKRVMLEAWGPFHPCSLANMCCARNLKHSQKQKITLMGFLYPEEYETALREGHCAKHSMCYICTLMWVLLQWCVNEGNNHQNKFIELPFTYRMNQPGEYRCGMIQSLNGHVNGLVAPFRHMTFSDFVEHSETVTEMIATGGGDMQRVKRVIHGFQERSELFFLNSSSDSSWSCNYSVRPSVYSIYDVTPLTTESLLRAKISTSKIGEQYVALLYQDDPTKAERVRLEPLFNSWDACVTSLSEHVVWTPGLDTKTSADTLTWKHLNVFSWICLHTEPDDILQETLETALPPPPPPPPPPSIHTHIHYYVMHYRVNVACALMSMLYGDARARADKQSRSSKSRNKRGNEDDELARFKKPRQKQLEHHLILFLESHNALISWYKTRSAAGADISDDALLADAAYARSLKPCPELYLYAEDLNHVQFKRSIRRTRSPQSQLRRLMFCHEIEKGTLSEAHARLFLLSFHASFDALLDLSSQQRWDLLHDSVELFEWRPHPLLQQLLQLEVSAWDEPDANGRDTRCCIVLTLLLRVNYGLRLLQDTSELLRDVQRKKEEEKDTEQQKRQSGGEEEEQGYGEYNRLMDVSFQLRCYINSHLELAFHVVEQCSGRAELCTDAALSGKQDNTVSAYDLYYPASRRAFQEGDLPDLSKQMPAIKFVVDNTIPEKTLKAMGSPRIYAMLGKLMPGVCFKRVLNVKHIESCALDAAYKEWAKVCLRISLMGMYHHCCAWPSFEDSMQLNAAFSNESLDSAMTFMTQRPLITSNALREFGVFTMKMNPGYLKLVKLLFDGWDTFEHNVKQSMDTARHLGRQHSNYASVEYAIEKIFEVNPHKPVYRSTSTDFPRFMVKEFEALNSGRDEKEERTKDRRISIAQRMEYSMESVYKNAIDAHVCALEPWSEIKLDTLLDLGLSKDGYDRLLIMWRMFMTREVKDTSRDQMHALGLRDYDILHYFFYRLDQHYRLTAVPLTAEMTARQERALRKRYRCPDSQPLTPIMMAMMMTRCCKEIKTFCCPRLGKNDPPNACDAPNYYGHVRIYWDRQNGSYRCDKKSNGSKSNRRGSGRGRSGGGASRQKTVDKYRMPCRSQPVQLLNAFGKVYEHVKMSEMGDAVARTFCPSCGQLFEFALNKIGMNGLTCGLCDERERTRFALPRCICCTNIPRRIPDGKYWLVIGDGCNGSAALERVYTCATCTRRLNCFGEDNVTYLSSLLHYGRKASPYVYRAHSLSYGVRLGLPTTRAQIRRTKQMYSNKNRN